MNSTNEFGNEAVSRDQDRSTKTSLENGYAYRIASSLNARSRELACVEESMGDPQTSWTAGDNGSAPDGTRFVLYNGLIHAGGDRNWRNNNAGNIEAGNFANAHGAIGDDGHFAIFPDAQMGLNALIALLQAPVYNNLSLREAMFTYAPPNWNNTQGYLQYIKTQTGLDSDSSLKSLTVDQFESVAKAIRKHEGNTPGQVYLKDSTTNPRWAKEVFGIANADVSKNPLELIIGTLKSPFPKVSSFLNAPKTRNIDELLQRLEIQRHLVDGVLTKPARWRGQMRREVHKHDRPGEKERFAHAFDRYVAEVYANPHWELDIHKLKSIHDIAVGGEDFRDVQIRVGRHHVFPEVSEVPMLVDRALRRVAHSIEPAPVTAMRLYLELLTIHPFFDGNGRTTRLIATLWLVRAGFCSTLFTAVEQHFHPAPARYLNILDQFRFGEIDGEQCIAHLLLAMIANSMYAAWFRDRERRLRKACRDLGIPVEQQDDVMVEYDLRYDPGSRAGDLARSLELEERPWHTIEPELTPMQRSEFSLQLQRILDEEQEDN